MADFNYFKNAILIIRLMTLLLIKNAILVIRLMTLLLIKLGMICNEKWMAFDSSETCHS